MPTKSGKPGLPSAWESSLKSILSKIRAALSRAGLPGAELIRNSFGAYQFQLPRHGWVDVDAAVLAVHLAEAALTGGDLDSAAGHAFVARLITARPFLPGVEGIWADEWRRKLQALRIRAVECMADVQLQRGQTSAAIQSAELVVGLDELRESGWRILMRAHAAAGNVGTALRAFERCSPDTARAVGDGAVSKYPCRAQRAPSIDDLSLEDTAALKARMRAWAQKIETAR